MSRLPADLSQAVPHTGTTSMSQSHGALHGTVSASESAPAFNPFSLPDFDI